MNGRLFSLSPPKPPADVREAAEWWLARRSLGRLTVRDEARLRDWLMSADHAACYAEVEALYAQTAGFAAEPEIMQLRAKALREPRALPVRVTGVAAGLAAAFILGIVLVGVTPPVLHQAGPTDLGGQQPLSSKRYETQVGQRQRLRLDDGSIVTLNTGSLLEVAYNKGRRDVRLLRGQALFQVAHNSAWPFVVMVADREVTAVGTAFDVRLDGAVVRVVLLEGKVRITPLRREGVERLLPQFAQETLSPGEGLVALQGTPRVKVAAADVQRATSWTQGQLIFRDDTLASAVEELNRYSATQILVDDPRVAALKVSGVFSTDRPQNFIAAVTAFYPVDPHQSSPGVTELVWRKPA